VPAFVAAYLGMVFVYLTAMTGGHYLTPLHAAWLLFSSPKGLVSGLPLTLMIVHIGVFIYLLVRFARGRTLPRAVQIYCMTIVILAIGERIRLNSLDGEVFFWFGLWSLPHALCLFLIVWLNRPIVTKPALAAKVRAT
jgi:hypothetical protein